MIIYSKTIPVKYETDVLVVGGGPSGVAAAISAARMGNNVFLAENNGCFGGSGTTGLVPSFAQFTDGEKFLVGGVGREIRDLTIGEECDYKRYFYKYSVEKLKRVYDRLVTSEKNLKFSFFTRMIDVISKKDRVEYVVFAAKSGIFSVKAKIYIDCTGDADLCAWAGADFNLGNEEGNTMPPTLCSLWSNIEYDRCDFWLQEKVELAIRDGFFSQADRHVPGIMQIPDANGMGGGNVGHVFGTNAIDEVSLTHAMVKGRLIVEEFGEFYRKYCNGFENSYLCYTADMLGIRESRRIIGDYTLTGDDFKKRASFNDEIGRYAYPVDIHIMKPDEKAYKAYEDEFTHDMCYGVGESYGIPYRVLIPIKLSNVLTAGRCVSTDRQMQASIRVMPGCYITGQAAGVAGALASEKEDTRAVDTVLLQDSIIKSGGKIYR